MGSNSVDKNEGERKRQKGERGENRTKERERKKKTKRRFRFSLRSMKIGPSVFIGGRSKVDPHKEGYTWVTKS